MADKVGNLEDINRRIGNYGPWQRNGAIVFFFLNLIGNYQNFAITFMAPNIDFWCVSPSAIATIEYASIEETTVMNFTDQCEVPIGVNRTMVPCTQWEYDMSEYSETIISEWDLVCDREWMISFSKSIYMVGFMVAGMLSGHVSDWIGRYPTIVICYVITCISTMTSPFSTSYTMFAILRFFCAVGRTGMATTGIVLLTEIISPEWRSDIFVGVRVGWCIGFLTLPAVAYLIRPWYWFQLAISVPIIPLVAVCWLVPESPRWLLTKGKTEEFIKVMCKALKQNGREIKDDEIASIARQRINETAKSKTILDLFKTPQLARRTLFACAIWVANSFIYYALSYNTNDLGGNIYLNFFIAGVTECLSVAAIFCFTRIYGRKVILIVGMISGGIACGCLIVIPPEIHWLVVTLSMIGRFFITTTFTFMNLYTTEIFPTPVRNIAIGTCSTCARVGSIAAPFVRELEKVTHYTVPPAINAGLAISSGFLVFFLPETKNCKIPDTMEEGERFGQHECTDSSSEKEPLIKSTGRKS